MGFSERNSTYLFYRIEHSGFAWIVPNAGIVLPISPIVAQVVVGQETLVPFGTNPPIYPKMLREKRSDILA